MNRKLYKSIHNTEIRDEVLDKLEIKKKKLLITLAIMILSQIGILFGGYFLIYVNLFILFVILKITSVYSDIKSIRKFKVEKC